MGLLPPSPSVKGEALPPLSPPPLSLLTAPRDIPLRDGVIRRNADYTDGLVRPHFYGRPARWGGRGAAGRRLQMGRRAGMAGMAGPFCAGTTISGPSVERIAVRALRLLASLTCWPARCPCAVHALYSKEEKPNSDREYQKKPDGIILPSWFLSELTRFLFSRRRHHAERI